MAEDEFVPGNLLFADGNALKTTDGTTTSLIAGSSISAGYLEDVGSNARFNAIFSFIQLSRSLIVLADINNYCFRNVDRTTNLTSTYSGNCTNRGDRDGVDALFDSPVSIIQDVKNNTQLLIADFTLGSLRKIILASKHVSTIYKDGSYRLSTLLQDPSTGNIYVTFAHGSGLFDYESTSFSVVTGSSRRGFVDGAISQIRFDYPRGVAFLSPHKLLIADSFNHRLRVLDLITNTSSSICSGFGAHLDGDLSSCQLSLPQSLLTVNDVIFVGEYRYIRSIHGKYHCTPANINIRSVVTLILCSVRVQLLQRQCVECIDSSTMNLQSMCVYDTLAVVWALFLKTAFSLLWLFVMCQSVT